MVKVQDCRKINDHLRGIYRIYSNLMKEKNRRMSTYNQLDWQTLGSQRVIMPKNLPDPCANQGQRQLHSNFMARQVLVLECFRATSHTSTGRKLCKKELQSFFSL